MTSTLIIPPTLTVSQEQFELLATANRDLRLERSRFGLTFLSKSSLKKRTFFD